MNEEKRGSSTGPSTIAPPIGFGRSSTHTDLSERLRPLASRTRAWTRKCRRGRPHLGCRTTARRRRRASLPWKGGAWRRRGCRPAARCVDRCLTSRRRPPDGRREIRVPARRSLETDRRVAPHRVHDRFELRGDAGLVRHDADERPCSSCQVSRRKTSSPSSTLAAGHGPAPERAGAQSVTRANDAQRIRTKRIAPPAPRVPRLPVPAPCRLAGEVARGRGACGKASKAACDDGTRG